MNRVFIFIAGLLAAMVLGITPAQATTTKECKNVAGEYGSAKVCGYVQWHRKAGSNDLVITRHSIRLTSSYSDADLGYVDMYDIIFTAREVVSGVERHSEYNQRTGSRLWAHEQNFRSRSGYMRFYFDFDVGWTGIGPIGWPDDHVTFSYTIN